MWKKIDAASVTEHLKTGKIIIKYPLNNVPVDNLDLTDGTRFIRYQIASRNQFSQDYYEFNLSIPMDEIPDIPLIIAGMKVTGITNNEPVLHKNSEELIKEDVWWYEY